MPRSRATPRASARRPESYASDMSGNRGPSRSSFGPTSGSAPAPRGPPRRSPAPLAVQCAQLGKLALEQRAKSRHIRLKLALDVGALPLDLALRGPRLFDHAPRLGLRLTHDDLGFALGRRARLFAELLRRDERLVHRALPLPVHTQLFPQGRQPLFEHRLLAQDPLELVRDAHAEVVDAQRLVAPQAAAELLLADVVRREVERVAAHVAARSRGPNRTVPKRITVAPSSTARP